jgi:hypothetical protein
MIRPTVPKEVIRDFEAHELRGSCWATRASDSAAAGTGAMGCPAARSGGAVAGRKGAVPIGTAPHHACRGFGGGRLPVSMMSTTDAAAAHGG